MVPKNKPSIQGEVGHSTYRSRGRYGYEYADGSGVPLDPTLRKPCFRCRLPPTAKGHDPCIADLPNVVFACCGHGYLPGYVTFTDGRVLRFHGKTGEDIRAMVDLHLHGRKPLPAGWTWDG